MSSDQGDPGYLHLFAVYMIFFYIFLYIYIYVIIHIYIIFFLSYIYILYGIILPSHDWEMFCLAKLKGKIHG